MHLHILNQKMECAIKEILNAIDNIITPNANMVGWFARYLIMESLSLARGAVY